MGDSELAQGWSDAADGDVRGSLAVAEDESGDHYVAASLDQTAGADLRKLGIGARTKVVNFDYTYADTIVLPA